MIPFLIVLMALAQAPVADEPVTPPEVIYPADAQRQRIQGAVEIEVSVDVAGKVTGVKALAGPEVLRQAAVEAYLKAAYRPLLRDGKPVPAVIRTSVNFSLHEAPPVGDLAVAKQFDSIHARCQELSRQHSLDALVLCRQALELGKSFSAKAYLEQRAQSYNDVVVLLIARKQYDEASVLGEEAVAAMASAKPVSEASATVYITRAETRSLSKDLHGSESDCIEAEEILNSLLPNEMEVDRAASFRNQLRETLLLHAVVLDKEHKTKEAKEISERARSVY